MKVVGDMRIEVVIELIPAAERGASP